MLREKFVEEFLGLAKSATSKEQFLLKAQEFDSQYDQNSMGTQIYCCGDASSQERSNGQFIRSQSTGNGAETTESIPNCRSSGYGSFKQISHHLPGNHNMHGSHQALPTNSAANSGHSHYNAYPQMPAGNLGHPNNFNQTEFDFYRPEEGSRGYQDAFAKTWGNILPEQLMRRPQGQDFRRQNRFIGGQNGSNIPQNSFNNAPTTQLSHTYLPPMGNIPNNGSHSGLVSETDPQFVKYYKKLTPPHPPTSVRAPLGRSDSQKESRYNPFKQ